MSEEFTCPSGHKLPPELIRSTVDLKVESIDDAIVFACPRGKRGHTFTLRKAVASSMFNIEQAAKIRRMGEQTKRRNKNGSTTK